MDHLNVVPFQIAGEAAQLHDCIAIVKARQLVFGNFGEIQAVDCGCQWTTAIQRCDKNIEAPAVVQQSR